MPCVSTSVLPDDDPSIAKMGQVLLLTVLLRKTSGNILRFTDIVISAMTHTNRTASRSKQNIRNLTPLYPTCVFMLQLMWCEKEVRQKIHFGNRFECTILRCWILALCNVDDTSSPQNTLSIV